MVHGALTVVLRVRSVLMALECVIMKQDIVHVLLGTKVQHALKVSHGPLDDKCYRYMYQNLFIGQWMFVKAGMFVYVNATCLHAYSLSNTTTIIEEQAEDFCFVANLVHDLHTCPLIISLVSQNTENSTFKRSNFQDKKAQKESYSRTISGSTLCVIRSFV